MNYIIRTDIAKSFSDMNDISGQLKDSMDATNNEKRVNSITKKSEITYSMVNKLDSLTKANSNTAKELNKIVDQFR